MNNSKTGEVMKKYSCMNCNATGVRLWRGYMQFRVDLRCAACTEKHEGAKINHANHQCRWSVPAIPIEGESGRFHGYLSTPVERSRWWVNLPLTNENNTRS